MCSIHVKNFCNVPDSGSCPPSHLLLALLLSQGKHHSKIRHGALFCLSHLESHKISGLQINGQKPTVFSPLPENLRAKRDSLHSQATKGTGSFLFAAFRDGGGETIPLEHLRQAYNLPIKFCHTFRRNSTDDHTESFLSPSIFPLQSFVQTPSS